MGEQGPLLCPAGASGRAQVRTSTAPSPFLPFLPSFLPSSHNSGRRRQCEHFPSVRQHVLFTPLPLPAAAEPDCSHHVVLAVPPLVPGTQLGRVAPWLFPVHVGVLLRKKTYQTLKSLLQNKLLQCGDAELRSYFFFLTLATKCKTYPVVFNYTFTPYFSKDITTLP